MDLTEATNIKKSAAAFVRRIAKFDINEVFAAQTVLYKEAGERDDDMEYQELMDNSDFMGSFAGLVMKAREIEHANPGCST